MLWLETYDIPEIPEGKTSLQYFGGIGLKCYVASLARVNFMDS